VQKSPLEIGGFGEFVDVQIGEKIDFDGFSEHPPKDRRLRQTNKLVTWNKSDIDYFCEKFTAACCSPPEGRWYYLRPELNWRSGVSAK